MEGHSATTIVSINDTNDFVTSLSTTSTSFNFSIDVNHTNHGNGTNISFMTANTAIEEAVTFYPYALMEQNGIISDEVAALAKIILIAFISGIFAFFGIIANTLNVIVFYKMGYKDTINIAFTGLSIADLISLIGMLFNAVCNSPLLHRLDLPVLYDELMLMPGTWLQIMFVRASGVITAYITLERCLCIALPIKVKELLTPRRVTGIIVGICVIVIGSLFPNLCTIYYVWKFIPSQNRTMLGVVHKNDIGNIKKMSYYLIVIYMMSTFLGVVICSLILIWKIKKRVKWLTSASSSVHQTSGCKSGCDGDDNNIKNKSSSSRTMSMNNHVVKMVMSVAVIYIVSFTPMVGLFLGLLIEPQFNFGRRYNNLYWLLSSLTSVFMPINGSVNIFVYYNQSSKFANVFSQLFCRKKNAKRVINKYK